MYGEQDINELVNGFITASDWERIDKKIKGNPIAVCTCGHTGGCPQSEHSHEEGSESMRNGYGHCTFEGCFCSHFRFAQYTEEFLQALLLIESGAMV